VGSLSELEGYEVKLLDVTPRQLLRLGPNQFTASYKRRLGKYRYGPGVFKVDYALNSPIPWTAFECSRAATVHLGGGLDEIAQSEDAARRGRHAERPFVLLVQPSLFDSTRAPQGKHTAWAYCHVPNGSNTDMLERIEAQIERFAPGFRDCILARRVFTPSSLEQMDANLIGGDIGGGVLDFRQFLFRPTWRQYATSSHDIYLCSSSTPPGGAVHGMCGYHAARTVLSRFGSG
jgi:phytoene dehydrogenase-like protein